MKRDRERERDKERDGEFHVVKVQLFNRYSKIKKVKKKSVNGKIRFLIQK